MGRNVGLYWPGANKRHHFIIFNDLMTFPDWKSDEKDLPMWAQLRFSLLAICHYKTVQEASGARAPHFKDSDCDLGFSGILWPTFRLRSSDIGSTETLTRASC